MDLTASKLLLAIMLVLLAAPSACAQLNDEIPHASYYAAVQAVYSGDYRTAARELGRETQRGIHTTQARWIDSICYYAMLGEVLYHQGRNAEALAQFDQACQLLLAYPNWLLQVRFQAASGPRPDPNRARRIPPWGRSTRTFALGQFPASEQVLVGDLNAENVIRQGGVYRAPMLLRINVIEVVRMSALAIRRRNELLGPLSSQDAITRQLSTVLAGGNLAPANHWSGAWIDLLRGLAQMGAGKLDEADALLGRSLVIDGQFDHPLTGVGLLEQGRIAMIRGDTRRAAQLLADAGFSAYYFEDWDVLTESTVNGWINHMASGAGGVYPPLEPVATWAQANRLQHVATKLRLAQAESLMWLGEMAAGASLVDDAGRRIGEMRTGLPGIQLVYTQAVAQILQGRIDQGGDTLTRAIAAQAGASLRNFQIARTNSMYDAGAASARLAVGFYSSLLADPSPSDWLRNPLDAMTVVQTGQDAAFDRWFLAAMERKEPALALEVAERAKRRRYLANQPLGGRLLALRAILEAPEAELSRDGQLQRQQILAAFPDYRSLWDAGRQIYVQLQASPILASNAAEAKPLAALYDQWDHNAIQRQHLLAQLAVRRLPSSLEFPPMRTAAQLQESLAAGESLVEFHTVGDKVFGFLVTKSNIDIWQLPDARRLRTGTGNFLHALGIYSANRDLSVVELKNDAWRKTAKETYTGIFKDARLDINKTTGLLIVPDGALWYLPFEALIAAGGKNEKVLGDRLPIRYGPTAALAVSNPAPMRRAQHTGILAGDLKFAGEEPDRAKLLQDLVGVVPGPLVLPEPLPQPARLIAPLLDNLIVFEDLPSEFIGDSSTLFPRSRGAGKDKEKTASSVTLPYGGPERVALTGYKTEAEQGLKGSRSTRSTGTRTSTGRASGVRESGAAGDEVFQSLCNLMAGGTRVALLTRWRTSGRTNFDLVREFAMESIDAPAAEAWQRACLLARENPIDQAHEPRLKHSDDTSDAPKADHPFFWAGYLLVDTGPRPEKSAKPAAPKNEVAKDKPLPPPNPAGAGEPNKAPAAEEKPSAALTEGVAPPKSDTPDTKSPKTK